MIYGPYRRPNITEYANIALKTPRNFKIFSQITASALIAERAKIATFLGV
jgi:hypothetical protein